MNILLGITGSIAAYKAADLASQLVKAGHEVHVVMTRTATEFITPLTLQVLTRQPVLAGLEDEKQSWKPGHIELADQAEVFLVAPASGDALGNFVPATPVIRLACMGRRDPAAHGRSHRFDRERLGSRRALRYSRFA